MQGVLEALQEELEVIRRQVRKPSLQYRTLRTGTSSTVEFLIELRRTEARSVPDAWMVVSDTKSLVRYHTPRVATLLKDLQLYREEVELSAAEAWTAWLSRVGDECCQVLRSTVNMLGQLDCLVNLRGGGDRCRWLFCREIFRRAKVLASCQPQENMVGHRWRLGGCSRCWFDLLCFRRIACKPHLDFSPRVDGQSSRRYRRKRSEATHGCERLQPAYSRSWRRV